jgi:regulator of cell morphogenesis and NO signaling
MKAQKKTLRPDASVREIIDHIVDTHHVFTRVELARTGKLLRTCLNLDPKHRRLAEVFDELDDDLRAHLAREEQVLYPHASRLEEARHTSSIPPRAMFGAVANPIGRMEAEHDRTADLLKRMRSLTLDYACVASDGEAVAALYEALRALDEDLVEHMHMEQHVLFPAIVRLETAATNGDSATRATPS